MKTARLLAYQNIEDVEYEDLCRLNAIFKSPEHNFDDSKSESNICEFLQRKYAKYIERIFNPTIRIEFGASV